ncbi:hypothetical protein BC832DRAFT_595214 [Gaertneriomyces semiglobifer]|nr:hypothetical protein BC832DRAFT_595214 [Gaertneriomyces semiglobifer]
MFPAVDAALDWKTPESTCGRFALVTDELQSDGTFILQHFISRHLRSPDQRCKVVLLGLAQTLANYIAIGKKLGLNLPASSQNGRFQFIDGSSNLQEFAASPTAALKSLLVNLSSAVRPQETRPCVVIDDLSVLLYSGVPLNDIITFVATLRSQIEKEDGFLAVLVHADPSGNEDVEQRVLNTTLMHMTDYILHVQPLKSGVTQGVDGQLTLARGPLLDVAEFRSTLLHYKIGETGVQFYQRGLSGGVL